MNFKKGQISALSTIYCMYTEENNFTQEGERFSESLPSAEARHSTEY